MKNSWSIIVTAVFASIAILASCGPVNTEPKPSNLNDSSGPVASGATKISKGSHFYVYTARKGSGNLLSNSSDGEVGDNEYVVRFAHCEDLQFPSNDATINVTYWMPDMPDMGKSEAAGIRQPDGSFLITLFYSMPGRWEITLKIKNGSMQDEHVFETKI